MRTSQSSEWRLEQQEINDTPISSVSSQLSPLGLPNHQELRGLSLGMLGPLSISSMANLMYGYTTLTDRHEEDSV